MRLLEASSSKDEQSLNRQNYATFNFIITARHLAHDLLPKNSWGADGQPEEVEAETSRVAASLRATQDIAHGSKHVTITKYKPTTTFDEGGIFDYETMWPSGPQHC